MAAASDRAWLLGILLVAAALRLYGLDHGLPHVYNPDEANIMARALSVARSLDPEYYLYPSFWFYFLFAVMGGLFVLGRVTGRYESLSSFESRFFVDPTDFYLAGRLAGVVLALATIVLVERLARKHFGRTVSRAAAVFLALGYVQVRDSHYLKHDVPAAFLVVLALWAFDRAMERKSLGSYLLSGGAMGVAFATHYYTIFLAPAFVLCHLAHRGRASLSRVALAGAFSALVFFLLSPFVLLRLGTALDHMRANRQVVMDRSFQAGSALFPSLGSYLEFLAEQALGYVLLALALAGILLLARRGPRALSLWGAFPLFFFLFLTYTFFAGRYLNPMLPFFAVAAGLAVAAIERRRGAAAAAVTVIAASLQPLYYAVQVDRLFAGEDTRTLARHWILEKRPAGETLALQSYSVPLPQSKASFEESLAARGALSELDRRGKYWNLLAVAEKEEKAYRLVFLGKGDELNRIYVGYDELASGLGPLCERGVSSIVLRRPPIAPPPEVQSLFRRVEAEGKLLARISPFRSEPGVPYLDNEDWPPAANLTHKGPLVEIWSLGKP